MKYQGAGKILHNHNEYQQYLNNGHNGRNHKLNKSLKNRSKDIPIKPMISVLLSVHDAERHIAKCIESILEQTYKDFEFIIVDDHSTDLTLDIIKEYAAKDKRIILIINEENLGITKSLNKGLKIAKGKFIARTDDDIAVPERFRIQLDYLEKHKEIFLVGSALVRVDERGHELDIESVITDPDMISQQLMYKACFRHNTIMFRNEKNFFYRDKFYYAQDYDLYLRLLSEGKKLVNIPDVLMRWRISPKSISFSKRAIQDMFAQKAIEFYHQRQKYGRDEYELFDPKKFLEFDAYTSNDKKILEKEARVNFQANNFQRSRKFAIKYFKNYGIFNRIVVYYFASFLNVKTINVLRKVWMKFVHKPKSQK